MLVSLLYTHLKSISWSGFCSSINISLIFFNSHQELRTKLNYIQHGKHSKICFFVNSGLSDANNSNTKMFNIHSWQIQLKQIFIASHGLNVLN